MKGAKKIMLKEEVGRIGEKMTAVTDRQTKCS